MLQQSLSQAVVTRFARAGAMPCDALPLSSPSWHDELPLSLHRAPIPEEEPIPGEEPEPEEDPVPHPDPIIREPDQPGSAPMSVAGIRRIRIEPTLSGA